MKVLLSHPTGNQFVRALIAKLSALGLLLEFDTTIATNPDSKLLKVLPAKIRQEFLRRVYPISHQQIQTHPVKEFARTVFPKIGLGNLTKHETGLVSVDAVYTDLDKKVAGRLLSLKHKQLTGVYAYEDGAENTFATAKNLGLTCFYDLPIGYWRAAQQLLAVEAERWPDWAATLPGIKDSPEKLARKDKELQLADKIFVASQFTKSTLDYYPGSLATVEVIPYAFPEVIPGRQYDHISATRPLKLLFVGGLSQRKGIADVFEAVKVFGNRVKLTVVGQKTGNNCPALNEALVKHHWIPSLPHEQILALMRTHDVLLFPSLFEGFGLVITEAMAQGTPVITTDRTAGPNIITHGENGWLIEAGVTQQLIATIETILLKPQIVAQNGKAAMQKASERTWDLYGEDLVNSIINFY
jgi:glycosyltransferase involved in cell wall biosynthesis